MYVKEKYSDFFFASTQCDGRCGHFCCQVSQSMMLKFPKWECLKVLFMHALHNVLKMNA